MQEKLKEFASESPAAIVAAIVSEHENRVVASPDSSGGSRFEIGSTTKVLTGTLLGTLVESGDIDPSKSVNDYLTDPLPWGDRPPSLVELATHRSGLPNTPRSLFWREAAVALGFSTKDPWRGVSVEDYTRLLHQAARKTKIRTKASYSSMGIGLLGKAMGDAMGTDYETLLQDRLLKPLGMTKTGFEKEVTGKNRVEQPLNRKNQPVPYLIDHMPAAGAIASTADDLAKLIRAAWGEGPDGIVKGIQRAQQPVASFGSIKIGYCWLLNSDNDKGLIAFHSGASWGSQALLEVDLKKRTGFIALSAKYRDLEKLKKAS